MTLLQIVNMVLRRLREDTVAASTTTAYSRLIAEFVAQGHEEVKEAYDWPQFRKLVLLSTTSPTTYIYELTTATPDSLLLYDPVTDRPMAFVRNAAEAAAGNLDYTQLIEVNQQTLIRMITQDATPTVQKVPTYFSLGQQQPATGMWAWLWPYSENSEVVFSMIVPQAALDTDGTDDATELRTPWRPVFLYALMLALNERGEEIGEPGNLAEQNYYKALGAAIEQAGNNDIHTDRYEFRRD